MHVIYSVMVKSMLSIVVRSGNELVKNLLNNIENIGGVLFTRTILLEAE